MRRFSFLLISLGLLFSLSACDKIFGGGDEEDPAASARMVGLWFDIHSRALYNFVNLREDGTAVTSSSYAPIGEVGTSYYSSWKVTKDGTLMLGENDFGMYCEEGILVARNANTLEYENMSRIYDPKSGIGTKALPSLIGDVWAGYFEDKIITLQFTSENQVIRTYKPNTGWEGEEETRTFNYTVSNGVIHFEGVEEAWGVGVKSEFLYDYIFVDFGDTASLFSQKPQN